jgi:PIN domain nuclease of toxin-antitoxin system
VEAVTYLDTHVVVWLYAARRDLLSRAAKKAIEEDEIGISPIVLLELEYLRETGRIAGDPGAIAEGLERTIGLRICDLPFARAVEAARPLSWTRDPFDRLIVGHASALRAPLVTRDRAIRRRYDLAVW